MSTMDRGAESSSAQASDKKGEESSQKDSNVLAAGEESPSAASTADSEATVRPNGPPPTATANQPRRASRTVNKKDTESTKTLNSLLDQYKKTDVPASHVSIPPREDAATKITFHQRLALFAFPRPTRCHHRHCRRIARHLRPSQEVLGYRDHRLHTCLARHCRLLRVRFDPGLARLLRPGAPSFQLRKTVSSLP